MPKPEPLTVNVENLPSYNALLVEAQCLRLLLAEVRDWFDDPHGEPTSSELLERINRALA